MDKGGASTSKRSREEQSITASTSLDAHEAQGRPRSRPNMLQEPDQLAGIRAPQLGQYIAETSEVIEQHLIFLSHSGQEKDFTTRLDQALRSAGHNPFFDIRIPPAEEFTPHMLQNAQECKLGVVVLSPGFLTSKWPMRELHLMHTSPSKPKILPVFYEVQPNDLNLSSPYFREWRKEWRTFTKSDPIKEWEVAVTQLSKIEGVVCKDNMNIESFIEQVVDKICTVIPPPVRYDISHLTGCTRLTQEVAKLFEKIPEAPLRAIGFHGIGGQGKTTICKLMVHHYASTYPGRCVLMEFPSNSCDKEKVVRQCNKALEQLTNNGQANRHVYVDDFDQCVSRMKEQVKTHKVFIVIDNVWEDCLEFAQRILDVGFSRGSRVLVTSRSKEVLSNLLKGSGCRVMPLPGLNKEEARHAFLKSFNRNQTTAYTSTHELLPGDVDRVTASYRFKDSGYHPLTIRAVGTRLGRTTAAEWIQVWERTRGVFTGPNSEVDKAIKMNFENISEERRHLFLDVAFLYIPCIGYKMYSSFERPIEEPFILAWLSALYRGKMDKCVIEADLKQLAYDGLLEFEDLEHVRVHDLYTELAAREAAASGRFVGDGMDVNYAEAKRLHWKKGFGNNYTASNFPVRNMTFPELELLTGDKDECMAHWLQYADMPLLRMLEIGLYQDCKSDFNLQVEWRKMRELTWLWLHIYQKWNGFYHQMLEDISQLRHLLLLSIAGNRKGISMVDSKYGLCLKSLVNLQYLTLEGVYNLKEISGLDSLINLKHIVLSGLPDLLKVGVFSSSSTQLEAISVEKCMWLKEIEGLRNVQNLKKLCTSYLLSPYWLQIDHTVLCLKDSFVNLQYLLITLHDRRLSGLIDHDNELREISGLEGLIHLKLLTIEAPTLLKVGHFSNLSTQLEKMDLECEDLTEIQGLDNLPNLIDLDTAGYSLLRHENKWRSNDSLRQLAMCGGTHCTIKEISFFHGQFPRLKFLLIFDFHEVQDIDFSKLTSLSNLEYLLIHTCDCLEEIDWSCLNNLTKLKDISIEDCRDLKRIKGKPDGINHTLQDLSITHCPKLQKVEGLELLKGLPDEQATTLLQQLYFADEETTSSSSSPA